MIMQYFVTHGLQKLWKRIQICLLPYMNFLVRLLACLKLGRRKAILLVSHTWFVAILTFLYEISLYEMNLSLYGQPSQIILTMLNLFVVLLPWGFMYFLGTSALLACMPAC